RPATDCILTPSLHDALPISSADVPGELAPALENGTGTLLTRIPGGVPLTFDDVVVGGLGVAGGPPAQDAEVAAAVLEALAGKARSEEHTSELQSRFDLVCRL